MVIYVPLFHIDDLNISHKESEVVDDVVVILGSIFGELTVSDDKIYTYLGIDLDYSVSGEVRASMVNYFKIILEDFPKEIG